MQALQRLTRAPAVRCRIELMTWRRAVSRRRLAQLGHDRRPLQQEPRLVEPAPSHPRRHLVIALAGVARPAGGHHVLEGVATTARDRQHAVLLECGPVGATVRAGCPRFEDDGPVRSRQIASGCRDPAGAAARGSCPASLSDDHRPTLSRALHRRRMARRAPPDRRDSSGRGQIIPGVSLGPGASGSGGIGSVGSDGFGASGSSGFGAVGSLGVGKPGAGPGSGDGVGPPGVGLPGVGLDGG
jgi:hypothetical protein